MLIDYNMNVVKHSHERRYGFWSYLRSVLSGRYKKADEATVEGMPDTVPGREVGAYADLVAQPSLYQKIKGVGKVVLGDLLIAYGVALPLFASAGGGYSILVTGNIAQGCAIGLLSIPLLPAMNLVAGFGKCLRKNGYLRMHGEPEKEYMFERGRFLGKWMPQDKWLSRHPQFAKYSDLLKNNQQGRSLLDDIPFY